MDQHDGPLSFSELPNNSPDTGRRLVKEWLDSLDLRLRAEYRRAAISRHPTMTGDQRERGLVESLREFLPASIHVGTGKVISANERVSNQVDVVVSDGRFPILRQGDSALYPVESVIATIEVKSTIDARGLREAWSNCVSVMMRHSSVVTHDLDVYFREESNRGTPKVVATARADQLLRPRTYVFAYDGLTSLDSFSAAYEALLAEDGVYSLGEDTLLSPGMIVTGGVVCAAWGRPFRVIPTDAQLPPDSSILSVSFELENGFGLLASDLLWFIERRTIMHDLACGIRRAVSAYLPFEEYFQERVRGNPFKITTRPATGNRAG